jgi:hypothetical protein
LSGDNARMKAGLLILSALLALTAAAEDAQVLYLGTYHFANPGLDYVKNEVADVLTEQKQTEVREVVERLRRFNPTKIAVEYPAHGQAELDGQYAQYREGKLKDDRDETVQIGFRLAHLLKHERVYAVDVKGDMNLEQVVAQAQKHNPEFMKTLGTFMQNYTSTQNRMQKENTILEVLRWMNDPKFLEEGHRMYVLMSAVGEAGNYTGADELGAWYLRNARIFANLARMTKPNDRVLVIYGQGHVPILQQLTRDMPGMKVVATRDYL